MEEKICHKCHTTFSPVEHGQGVVIDNNIFICEDSHQKNTDERSFEEFSSSKQIINNEMPIALWLIKEQNKGKSFMSRKK